MGKGKSSKAREKKRKIGQDKADKLKYRRDKRSRPGG
jgi:hypothetical protein